jgi:hypothetical protein
MECRFFIATVSFVFVARGVRASDGSLDSIYGHGERITILFDLGGDIADQAFGARLQDDGKLVIVSFAQMSTRTISKVSMSGSGAVLR